MTFDRGVRYLFSRAGTVFEKLENYCNKTQKNVEIEYILFTFGISSFAQAPGSAFFILISCLVPRNETEDSLTVII